MHSRFRMKGVLLAALLAVLASAMVPSVASAGPEPGAKKKGFRLFARALGAMTVNRVYCGLAAAGQICVDSTNSSTIGGGFWPKGTADQYVFNSGLQIAGIIQGGPWNNDTVGGFFFDPKGTTEHGEGVQPIYNATNPDDLANWPEAACVPFGDSSATLFDNLLQTDPTNTSTNYTYPCRKTASQGDIWFMSWEGNTGLRAGRKHPLGIVAESRGMGWNFPSGNQDIIYFIYTFYNVSTTDPNAYLAHRASIRPILVQKANDLHNGAAALGVNLPTEGYQVTNMFAAFGADMDVGSAGSNYSSVNLPFALGYVYDRAFSKQPGWTFDPSLFGAPFFAGAGFIGVKYLKSPDGPGAIQLFSNTVNGSGAGVVNDPQNVLQLYRYLSGTLSPATGDQPCNVGNPTVTRICYVKNDSPADMRFFQSSTPLTLAPGEAGSIVVAYIFAAPVATAGCGAGCDVKPGDPTRLTNALGLAAGGGSANLIDSLTGFRGYTDGIPSQGIDPDTVVQQNEFRVVRGSLLSKALVAQAVFDSKFLLPFAPSAVDFFLVPGDNQVTVIWKPSASEDTGDPFFAIASLAVDPNGNNPLYDPNYRQFDVEGYRVYRGRVDAPNELQLLAQYDYTGTQIDDYTGIINPTPGCAPELGINQGTVTAGGCGLLLFPNNKDGTQLTAHRSFDLNGPIIQVNAGTGRVALAGGTSVQILSADTLVTAGGTNGACGPRSACPELSNSGVPFVYVDRTPRNNFRYFYSVTAFDVNSIESGPTSLESPRNTKSVRPVHQSSNYEAIGSLTPQILGRGVRVDNQFSQPTIDATTGKFSGPFPTTNAVTLGFVGEFASKVVGASGNLSLKLDSLIGGSVDGLSGGIGNEVPTVYWVTLSSPAATVKLSLPIQQEQSTVEHSSSLLFTAIKADQELAAQYGGDSSYSILAQMELRLPGNYYTNVWGRGGANSAAGLPVASSSYNGPRWFDGPSPAKNETKADPASGNGANNAAPVINTAADSNKGWNNAGALTGVTVVSYPAAYQTIQNSWRSVDGALGSFKRAADYNVYWNATTAGLIDSVIDVTHNLVVPFDSLKIGASYGILTQQMAGPAVSGDGRTQLTFVDWGCVQGLRNWSTVRAVPGMNCTPRYFLTRQATAGAIAHFATTSANAATSTATGTGFSLYMPGGLHMFQLTTLPMNTVWALRDYVGAVKGGHGFAGNQGNYSFTAITRPFSAVGVEVQVAFNVANNTLASTSRSLKDVHTVPDPYYVTSSYEQTTDSKIIKFVNLPTQAIIRIYSSSGVLVNMIEHPGPNCQNVSLAGVRTDPFGGECTWNVRNRNNQVVASGVYFYHVESNIGGGTGRRVGRMTIVNFAQ